MNQRIDELSLMIIILEKKFFVDGVHKISKKYVQVICMEVSGFRRYFFRDRITKTLARQRIRNIRSFCRRLIRKIVYHPGRNW